MMGAGFLTGNILFEPIADITGRKSITFYSSFLLFLLNIIIIWGIS